MFDVDRVMVSLHSQTAHQYLKFYLDGSNCDQVIMQIVSIKCYLSLTCLLVHLYCLAMAEKQWFSVTSK